MKRLLAHLAAAAALIGCPGFLHAQDFGNNTAELREVAAAELARPDIADNLVVDSPTVFPVPRPVYLVYRYYSCSPRCPYYVRDVFCNVVQRGQFHVEIVTAGALAPGDNVEGQIVTDINHPAYGLYCLTIRVAVPWNQWFPGQWYRWYVRWAWGAPYWCWQDHWWYYWQRPSVSLTLSGNQEVPPNNSPGSGTATVTLNTDGSVSYNVAFSGLLGGLNNAHFHGPAGPGVPAGVLQGLSLGTALNQTSGTLSGTIFPPFSNPNFLPALRAGQTYINLHSVAFPGGELRGQVPALVPTWCPYGPVWWPCARWTRWGTAWGLTICHPYCYRWNPFYIPRDFCLYGLRYYYTPLGNVRAPATPGLANPGALTPNVVPANNNLHLAALQPQPWSIYNAVSIGGIVQRPPYYYWPYTPYCQRWYWFRCLPFSLYRYNPPVVHYGIWQNPTPNPINVNFPDHPVNELPGNVCTVHTRPIVALPADLNGDGLVNAGDQAHFRQQNGTQGADSFFDVFVDLEAAPLGAGGGRKGGGEE